MKGKTICKTLGLVLLAFVILVGGYVAYVFSPITASATRVSA